MLLPPTRRRREYSSPRPSATSPMHSSKELSSENQFDAADKAIMQMAMVALNANGYRTLKSKPGHHQTAIQTLPLTVGLPQPKVIVLDALRKQRNLAD